MFENKTETEARKEILDLVAEYADKFHNQKKEFHEGDRIPYASRVYDINLFEFDAKVVLLRVILN